MGGSEEHARAGLRLVRTGTTPPGERDGVLEVLGVIRAELEEAARLLDERIAGSEAAQAARLASGRLLQPVDPVVPPGPEAGPGRPAAGDRPNRS